MKINISESIMGDIGVEPFNNGIRVFQFLILLQKQAKIIALSLKLV